MKCLQKALTSVLMAITAAGLTACHANKGTTPVQPATNQSSGTASEQPTRTYKVNIPATISDDGTFDHYKYAYIYNVTTGEMLTDGTWYYERQCHDGALTPTDISADGKKCNLTGTLSGAVSPGDKLVLLYELTSVTPDPAYCCFYYADYRDGTATGVHQGAMATATADSCTSDGKLTTMAPAVFHFLQTLFQFKFADENGTPINVTSLNIRSDSCCFTDEYSPLAPVDNERCTDEIYVIPFSPTSNYIYADIRFRESCPQGNVLTFTVTDAKGNDYKGTKPVPKGGFKNGKLYFKPLPIRLTKQAPRVKPTINWISVSEETEPDITFHNYEVQGPWEVPEGADHSINGPAVIAISGKSQGYWFHNNSSATITLNNLTATFDGKNAFIHSDSDLNIIVNGTNRIDCKNSSQCIASRASLKISGNGTLSVTANDSTYHGLFGRINYNDSNNSTTDRLAVYTGDTIIVRSTTDGTIHLGHDNRRGGNTVVLKSKTHNGDGTWTFTYKVTNASH